jgi:hypothetical protein
LCNSLANKDGFSTVYGDGSSYSDPSVFQTCDGGSEGPSATGEGPCNPAGTSCLNATTQGFNGPAACPTTDGATGALCEFSDGYCFPGGIRSVAINHTPTTESALLSGCFADQFQNGDLDFDGTPYQTNTWPNGSANTPTPIHYVGPFMASGASYPRVQFESDIAGSEYLCDTTTGQDCTVAPIGANFYPFWSLNNTQTLPGSGKPAGTCVWNFGNDIAGVTNNDFDQDGQYGSPDVARYGGTLISGVRNNPALQAGCGAPTARTQPTIAGIAEQGLTLTESHATWSNGSTSYLYQWEDCDSTGSNCSLISGATAQTYTPTASDVGDTIRVQEAVPGYDGTTGRETSARTAAVIVGPPTNTSAPTISGNTTEGQTLTESHGVWTNTPTKYEYRWEDCTSAGTGCVAIGAATAQSYALTASDVGHTIEVQETASNSTGASSPASSAATGVVQSLTPPPTKPANTAPPVISGRHRVGATLSSTTGLWSGTPPISYGYQWQRCKPGCVSIAGAANSSYKLVKADFGARIDVVVTATNLVAAVQTTSSEEGPIGPSVAQIKSLLLKLLAPHGSRAKIAALLSHGGYAASFTAPSAGRLSIGWYFVPKGAHLARAAKPTLIGRASANLHHAGRRIKLKIKLTSKGAKALKGTKRLTVTGKGTFTPSGLPGTTVKRKFTLKT